MTTQSIVAFMLLAILAFAMVAESSSSSNFDDSAVGAFVRTNNGFDEMTAGRVIGDRRALCDEKRITKMVIVSTAIPCEFRGASYYNCIEEEKDKIQAYKRSCNTITQCKSH